MRALRVGARDAMSFNGTKSRLWRCLTRSLCAATMSNTKLEADIAQLGALLSQDIPEGNTDVAELLRGIEAAGGMADGVEKKLDDMLNNLDHLLASLESDAPEAKTEEAK